MPDEKPPEPMVPVSDDPASGLAVAVVVLLLGAMGAGAWLLHREHSTASGAIEKTALTDLGPDAVTTPSGLRYKEFQTGGGATPTKGQTVIVHYHGRFPDGTVFDSSRLRGEAFRFPIGMGRVIKGWDEGIMDMKVGAIRRFVIPPNLAYGPDGSPPRIPPNATLVFDVELKAIE